MTSGRKKVDIFMLQRLNAEAASMKPSSLKISKSDVWDDCSDQKEKEEADYGMNYLEISTTDYDSNAQNDMSNINTIKTNTKPTTTTINKDADKDVKPKATRLLKNQPQFYHLQTIVPTISIIDEKKDIDDTNHPSNSTLNTKDTNTDTNKASQQSPTQNESKSKSNSKPKRNLWVEYQNAESKTKERIEVVTKPETKTTNQFLLPSCTTRVISIPTTATAALPTETITSIPRHEEKRIIGSNKNSEKNIATIGKSANTTGIKMVSQNSGYQVNDKNNRKSESDSDEDDEPRISGIDSNFKYDSWMNDKTSKMGQMGKMGKMDKMRDVSGRKGFSIIPTIRPPYPSKKAVILRENGSYDEIDYVTQLPQSNNYKSMVELILGNSPQVIGELEGLDDDISCDSSSDENLVTRINGIDYYCQSKQDKYSVMLVCGNQEKYHNNSNKNSIYVNKHSLPFPYNFESICGDILLYKIKNDENLTVVDYTIEEYEQYLIMQGIQTKSFLQNLNENLIKKQSKQDSLNNDVQTQQLPQRSTNTNTKSNNDNNRNNGEYDDIDISILSSGDEKNAELHELSPMKKYMQNANKNNNSFDAKQNQMQAEQNRDDTSIGGVGAGRANVIDGNHDGFAMFGDKLAATTVVTKTGTPEIGGDNDINIVLTTSDSTLDEESQATGARDSVEHSPKKMNKRRTPMVARATIDGKNRNKIEVLGGINGVLSEIIDISDIILEFDDTPVTTVKLGSDANVTSTTSMTRRESGSTASSIREDIPNGSDNGDFSSMEDEFGNLMYKAVTGDDGAKKMKEKSRRLDFNFNSDTMKKEIKIALDKIIDAVCENCGESTEIAKNGESDKRDTSTAVDVQTTSIKNTKKEEKVQEEEEETAGDVKTEEQVNGVLSQWERDYYDALAYVRLIANGKEGTSDGAITTELKLDETDDEDEDETESENVNDDDDYDVNSGDSESNVGVTDEANLNVTSTSTLMPLKIDEARGRIYDIVSQQDVTVADRVQHVLGLQLGESVDKQNEQSNHYGTSSTMLTEQIEFKELESNENDQLLVNEIVKDVSNIHEQVKQLYDINETNGNDRDSSEYSDDFEPESDDSNEKVKKLDGGDAEKIDNAEIVNTTLTKDGGGKIKVSSGTSTECKDEEIFDHCGGNDNDSTTVNLAHMQIRLNEIYNEFFGKDIEETESNLLQEIMSETMRNRN